MTKSYDILIVGIGGQGTILASNILGEACLIEARHVKGAETHGMAQRGGSVETHIGSTGSYGPLIVPGTADLLISFDLLEALRLLPLPQNRREDGGQPAHGPPHLGLYAEEPGRRPKTRIIAQLGAVRTLPDRCRPDCYRGWQQFCPECGDTRCGIVVDPPEGGIPACRYKKTRPAQNC